jgi:hypothetical protein
MFRNLAIIFAVALAGYAIAYLGIEHRRARKGPWEVAFTSDPSGTPSIVINQSALNITNTRIQFPGAVVSPDCFTNVSFVQPRQVPYDLPFGRCIFMDTTFLPGTIVFQMFGHEIQLIPRVLTLDGKEQSWSVHAQFVLPATNKATPLSADR